MKNNQPQHNEDMQALSEEQLDQVMGGAVTHPAAKTPAVKHPAVTHPAAKTPAVTTYTVQAGDSLSGIALQHEKGGDWQKLYNKNKSVIGNNPDLIYPGQKLNL